MRTTRSLRKETIRVLPIQLLLLLLLLLFLGIFTSPIHGWQHPPTHVYRRAHLLLPSLQQVSIGKAVIPFSSFTIPFRSNQQHNHGGIGGRENHDTDTDSSASTTGDNNYNDNTSNNMPDNDVNDNDINNNDDDDKSPNRILRATSKGGGDETVLTATVATTVTPTTTFTESIAMATYAVSPGSATVTTTTLLATTTREKEGEGSVGKVGLGGTNTATIVVDGNTDSTTTSTTDTALTTATQCDSVAELENNVARVLRELRPLRYDPSVPAWFRARRLSFTNYWDLNDWALHTSRRRYLRYVFGFIPKSRLLQRLLPPLAVLAAWTISVCALAETRPGMFEQCRLPLEKLSLVSTFVAALLALRTNQGLSRLREGRHAMAKMVQTTRDLALLFSVYVAPADPELALKAARLLALFGWTLKQHLRATDSQDILDALLLDHHPLDAAYISGERKRPVAILHRLRQITADVAQRKLIDSTEHRLIEQNIQCLGNVITTGERIRATPIPCVYGAHSARLMMFYLAALLWRDRCIPLLPS